MFRIIKNTKFMGYHLILQSKDKNKRETFYEKMWVGCEKRINAIEFMPHDTINKPKVLQTDIETKLTIKEYILLSSIMLKNHIMYDKKNDKLMKL